jgi:hypothetical protein
MRSFPHLDNEYFKTPISRLLVNVCSPRPIALGRYATKYPVIRFLVLICWQLCKFHHPGATGLFKSQTLTTSCAFVPSRNPYQILTKWKHGTRRAVVKDGVGLTSFKGTNHCSYSGYLKNHHNEQSHHLSRPASSPKSAATDNFIPTEAQENISSL